MGTDSQEDRLNVVIFPLHIYFLKTFIWNSHKDLPKDKLFLHRGWSLFKTKWFQNHGAHQNTVQTIGFVFVFGQGSSWIL